MRLELASPQAVRYACLKFHYSKAIPSAVCSFSVFNDLNEWCGVIIYSGGANQHLGKEFGLVQGQVCELVRVALNGKQECTSQALGLSLRLLKKYNPMIQLVISYSDCDQQHIGTIYQATNWIYKGMVQLNGGTPKFCIKGKTMHGRSVASKGWKQNIEWIRKHVDVTARLVRTKGKHKYLFPLNKFMRKKCLPLSKPYPKKENILVV
jgi:hypothetical protein